MRVLLRLALTACAVLFHTVPARAVEPEAVRFSYKGAVGCPGEEDFLVSVALNGGLFARADAATAREFAVSFEQGTPVVGRLTVRAGDGPDAVRARREIEGERCEDVARSLAVLMALALEPASSSPPVSPPSPPLRPQSDSPAPIDRSRGEVAPPIDRWRIGVSAEGTLSSGASSGLLAGLAFYAEVAHDSASAFAPAIRLGFETTATGTSDSATPPVTFSRRVARADVCPFRFAARGSWTKDVISADLCARLDAGVLEVASTQAPKPTTAEDVWVASGGLLRIRWAFPFFFFDLDGGAVIPLVRERFYFEPSTQVFEIPPVAGVGGIGLGGYFL